MRYKAHRLDLSKKESSIEKFEAMVKYLEIKDIFCSVANPQDYQFSKPTQKLKVIKVAFKGGDSSYIKTTLNECLELMDQSLNRLLKSDTSKKNLSIILNKIKSSSEKMQEIYDANDRLKFYDRYHFRIVLPDKNPMLHSSHLEFEQDAGLQIDEQFLLRKNFFKKIITLVNKKISEHSKLLETKKNLYKWTSKNPEFEIAEFIYALTLSGRLTPKTKPGKFNLFVEEVYNLFGISDYDYHRKTQAIRRKKIKKSFLTELAGEINRLK